MSSSLCNLRCWTKESIDRQCKKAYRTYEGAVIDRYTRYFAARPHLRCPRQSYSARSIAAALPPGYAGLQQLVPPEHLHRYARSGRSSQILGLALLGAATRSDPSMQWLWRALNLSALGSTTSPQRFAFEHALSPNDLGERPRVTKLDFVVSNPKAFVAVETKFSEPGFGICSCARDGDGSPAAGFECSARVRARKEYWRVAETLFGLNSVRLPLLPCALSANYQPIRTVAAACRLAQERAAVFVLIYDQNNPYFRSTGLWPGWPTMLEETLSSQRELIYRAISWQELLPLLPLPQDVRSWAISKHQLSG